VGGFLAKAKKLKREQVKGQEGTLKGEIPSEDKELQ
jgi:hypothetical protein